MSIRQGNKILANKTVPSIYTGDNGIVINNNIISAKDSTNTKKGIIRIATDIEATQGVDTDLAINPLQLSTEINKIDNSKVDKVNDPLKIYGTDSQGNQTTYDYDSFGKVDDVKVGDTSVVVNKIATLGTIASHSENDYSKVTFVDWS